jgi:hypothetical protein
MHITKTRRVETRDLPEADARRGIGDRSSHSRLWAILDGDTENMLDGLEALDRSDRLLRMAGAALDPHELAYRQARNDLRRSKLSRSLTCLSRGRKRLKMRESVSRIMGGNVPSTGVAVERR